MKCKYRMLKHASAWGFSKIKIRQPFLSEYYEQTVKFYCRKIIVPYSIHIDRLCTIHSCETPHRGNIHSGTHI